MPYSCQTCAKRKVKCDKTTPSCSSCRKSRFECIYQAPLPRYRKHRPGREVVEKLARYESILRENGLLDEANAPSSSSPATEDMQRQPGYHTSHTDWDAFGGSRPSRLVVGEGKSRYIDGSLWRDIEDDEAVENDYEEFVDDGQRASDDQ